MLLRGRVGAGGIEVIPWKRGRAGGMLCCKLL